MGFLMMGARLPMWIAREMPLSYQAPIVYHLFLFPYFILKNRIIQLIFLNECLSKHCLLFEEVFFFNFGVKYILLKILTNCFTENPTKFKEGKSVTFFDAIQNVSRALETGSKPKRVRRAVKGRPRVIRILVFADKALIRRYTINIIYCPFHCVFFSFLRFEVCCPTSPYGRNNNYKILLSCCYRWYTNAT